MAISKGLVIFQLVVKNRQIQPDQYVNWEDGGVWYGCFYYDHGGFRWLEVVKLCDDSWLETIALDVVES